MRAPLRAGRWPETSPSAAQNLCAKLQQFILALERCVALAEYIATLLPQTISTFQPNNAGAPKHVFGMRCSVPTVPFEAQYVEIVPNLDGSSTIQVDEEKPFRLSRGLSAFLLQLVSGKPGDDGKVRYKSRPELLQWLREYSRHDVNPEYVNKRVNVLRKRLRDAGIKRQLVDTDDVAGVRFALRLRPPRVTE